MLPWPPGGRRPVWESLHLQTPDYHSSLIYNLGERWRCPFKFVENLDLILSMIMKKNMMICATDVL